MSLVSDCRVALPQGTIEGTERAGVRRFLGIPYAQAPVGTLRFRAPVPPPKDGPRHDGRRFGPSCPQHIGPSFIGFNVDKPGFDEDCLRLNIWAKRPDGAARPVLVWIHGGAFLVGSSRRYSGAHFAAEHDVVVVTINYRLGVLGFVDFGTLTNDRSFESNLGLRDQIAALTWVRDHIAAFGGDPGRVTIAGESAGAMSVSLLMLSSASRGLFHGAVMQSGALSLIHDRAMAARVAHGYREVLGLGHDAATRLRAMPTRELLRAQIAVQRRFDGTIPAAPWFDGNLLPASLSAAHGAKTEPVPLLAGFNREEIRIFDMLPGARILPSRRAELSVLAEAQLGRAHARSLGAAYGAGRTGEREFATHATFGMPTLHFAERHSAHMPTWFYRFDMAHPVFGATHAQELLYLWDMRGAGAAMARGGPLVGARRALATRMRRSWCDFVKYGAPGSDWPRFDVRERRTRIFDTSDRLVLDPEQRLRKVWDGADFGPGFTEPLTRPEQPARTYG